MQSKLSNIESTIFTVMSNMAHEYNAINLSQGFPDFDCPDRLKELVSHHLYNGKNQYPPTSGIPELRKEIAHKLFTLYGHEADIDKEITVASGATEALFDAVQAIVSKNDEVIIFDPAYDSYVPAVEIAGAKAVHIPLTVPDYKVDWNRVKDAVNENTQLIIVNTPHNPCGSVFDATDLDALADVTRNKNIYILSDEVYEHMVYDGAKHQSVLCHAELKEKSFAIFSFGKTYHATGWKIAYCVAPHVLTKEFRKVHQYVTFTTTSFIQYGIADFMEECPQHATELPVFYQGKRDLFCKLLEDSKLNIKPSSGTYFQLIDYGALSKKNDIEFANYLTQEKGLAAIPLTPFYASAPGTSKLRFCFCKDDNTLEKAAEILCDLA